MPVIHTQINRIRTNNRFVRLSLFFITHTLLILSTLFSISANSQSVAWDQKDDVWLTQQTEHFSINFRQGHEEQANRVLDIAEQVHLELEPFFGYAPSDKTEIVLVDDYDYSNGWATPLPFAQIRLIMSPPEDVNSLEANDEWMHMLIRHEYTHIMHMEMGEGLVKSLRNVLGRNPLLFPHALTPSFMLEGLAVYQETNKERGYGRLQGSNYAMQMRMEVANKDLKELDEAAIASRKWPYGYNYLYGAYFTQYLAETYGEEKLQLFLKEYSLKVLPYFVLQSTAEKVYGKDFDELWSGFQSYLNDKFDGDLTQLVDQAVSGKALLNTPFLQVTATSNQGLLVDVNNGEDRNAIKQLVSPPQQEHDSNWVTQEHAKNIIAMDYDEKNGLVVSRLNLYANGRVLADLYLFKDNNWTRLTEQERLRKVSWSQNGHYVIASKKQDGLSELWLVDTSMQKSSERLWQGDVDVVLGAFDVSPDGKTLIASVKRPQQGWNLESLNLDDINTTQTKPSLQIKPLANAKLWTQLTHSKATENSPTFMSDNRVMYSADYGGIYNIYSLELNSGKVKKLTQEVGGAFEPKWQDKLGLVYQSYDQKNYTLRNIEEPKPLKEFDIKSTQANFNYPDPVERPAAKSTPKEYSPWSSLRPRSWLPIITMDDQQTLTGITTNGSDALARHQYQVSGSWDFKNDLAAYNVAYQYDNRWLLQASREHEFTTFTNAGKETYRIEQDDTVRLQRDHIFTALEDHLSLHAGLVWDKDSEVKAPKFGTTTRYIEKEQTLTGLALTFDNRESYVNTPGVGWGHYLDFVVETNELLNSDYSGEKYQGQWASTWDLPGRTTATLHLAGGYADSDAKHFKLGGNDLSKSTALFGRDTQALRGYDESAQVGNRYMTQRATVTTWLGRVERNWGLNPIGIGDISGSLFIDSGATWSKKQSKKQLTSAGASITVEAKFGYNFTLPITMGYAHGFDTKLGKDKFYVSVVSYF
ncbi:hypothetical protein MACH09_11160 [Vibrio sp. MACH09]|uniref:hypothetical protein n=1 Tax=Vibrio sp. MACH09 TaxID=3025122 RepID=UPI002791AE7D|nr:hypothetical protein [Vibrio sp. MACH09]GLO60608.1 hypothetical protein MACH09_11160 [Vibrio sp. MACH09]